MSRFYVGQPIKKCRGEMNIGVTAVVVAFHTFMPHGHTMQVRVTSPATQVLFGEYCAAPVGTECLADPDDWEPIIPEGLESLEEINALYEPQSETA